MIDEIHVSNLALIKEATLIPGEGLTVLTGETGAGKTALLSACKLLLGERADKTAVRDGADALTVSGRFFLPGAEGEETDAVVTRRVGADGRSRITLNGSMSSAAELAQTVAPYVDLCGQHEHQRLLKPATHVDFLDAWAGPDVAVPLAAYQAAYAEAASAQQNLEEIKTAQGASTAALDEARFTLRSIDAVSPQADEYEELKESLNMAEHAETLLTASGTAYQALSGEEGSALDALNTAIYTLDQAARYDEKLAGFAQTLREAVYIAEDAAADILNYRDAVDLDPAELARMQDRMSAFLGLLRMYGPTMDEVFAARERAAQLVTAVDTSGERLKAAQVRVDAAEAALKQAADTLDKARKKAAPRFAKAVTAQMVQLNMAGAALECQIVRKERSSWTKAGASAVEFLFQPGSGLTARPLARIASGGEVSRVMLALKVVLGEKDTAQTLIFDEVDAGVGGATAAALGAVLAKLAQTHQVIVVTHLAQVAVYAQKHYVVSKTAGDMPETSIFSIEGADRIQEIARMLSGECSDTACLHASEMLAAAQSVTPHAN